MKIPLRTLSALSALAITLSACDDRPKPTEDVLAQDSTLALAVMNAKADSILPQADESLSTAIDSSSGTAASVAATHSQKPVATASPAKPSITIPSEPAARRVAISSSTPRAQRSRRTSVPAESRRSSIRRTTKTETAEARVATTSRPERRSTSSATPPTATKMSALIPAGSNIELTSDDRVCSSNSTVGDTFTTRVAEDIVGPFGVVIPKGAIATAEVFTKKNDSRTNSAADVGIRIQSVTIAGKTYPVESLVTSSDITKVRRSRNDAGKVVTGAGLGAVLGRVLGHDTRSTVIGAVGGAAAGAVVARQTGKVESCIPNGGRITARLTEPLRVALTD